MPKQKMYRGYHINEIKGEFGDMEFEVYSYDTDFQYEVFGTEKCARKAINKHIAENICN